MGHKVNPKGLRQGLFPRRVPSNGTPNSSSLSLFRGEDFHQPCANVSKGRFSEQWHTFITMENMVVNFCERSGLLVSRCMLKETSQGILLYLDLFQRSRTSKKILLRKREVPVFKSKRTLRGKPSTKGIRRRLSWTFRRQRGWRPMGPKDFKFLQVFFEKHVTCGMPVIIKGRMVGNLRFEALEDALMRSHRLPFFSDGVALVSLISKEPGAALLAKFMSLELKDSSRHRTLISFIFSALAEALVLQGSALKGCRIQIKGRVDRSARSTIQQCKLGVMPLQTLESKLDYGFSEVVTKYGVCSIKVWLCYG